MILSVARRATLSSTRICRFGLVGSFNASLQPSHSHTIPFSKLRYHAHRGREVHQRSGGPRPLLTVEQLGRVARSRHTYIFFGSCVVGAVVFYFANVESVPVSGRKRFNCYGDGVSTLSDQQLKRIMYDIESQGLRVLPENDYRYGKVEVFENREK